MTTPAHPPWKSPPYGVWYMQIQKLELRGDSADTLAKLENWVKEGGDDPERNAFAEGIYYGMKWAGCFFKASYD